jgi:hypothetical protein
MLERRYVADKVFTQFLDGETDGVCFVCAASSRFGTNTLIVPSDPGSVRVVGNFLVDMSLYM